MLLADGRNKVRMVEHQPVHSVRMILVSGFLWRFVVELFNSFLLKVREGHKIFIFPRVFTQQVSIRTYLASLQVFLKVCIYQNSPVYLFGISIWKIRRYVCDLELPQKSILNKNEPFTPKTNVRNKHRRHTRKPKASKIQSVMLKGSIEV